MARMIGFGGPLIFILIFLLINKEYLTTPKAILYSVLIYVLSIATGIGLTIPIGAGSIFSGVLAPIFYTILFSIICRNNKSNS